jgi:hypothetical protein
MLLTYVPLTELRRFIDVPSRNKGVTHPTRCSPACFSRLEHQYACILGSAMLQKVCSKGARDTSPNDDQIGRRWQLVR